MIASVIYDNPGFDYEREVEVSFREITENCIFAEIKEYKPDELRLEAGRTPSIGWKGYEDSEPTTWLKFNCHPNWSIYSAMCHRDGINVVLVKDF